MGWVRCAVIAKQDMKDNILETLKEFHEPKLLTERDGMALFAYEGRYVAQFDEGKTLTIGVDDRNVMYYINGNEDLASTFDAHIELTIGFAIHLSDKAKLEKNAKAKKLLKKISKFNNQDEENEDDDSYSCRFDIRLSEESADLMKSLKELAAICDDLGIEHRVTLFDDSFGDVLGDFSDYDDSRLYIGPSACACAQWEQEVVRTETISLFLNHGETLVQ